MTKYLRTYNQLMSKALTRTNLEGYYEKHHIIPKAYGGDNSNSNITRLTAREHYVAHLLLYKHYRKIGTAKEISSSAYALLYFLNASREERTPGRLTVIAGKSKVFAEVRETLSKLRKGKPLIDLIGADGFTNYLEAHKSRRKYTDIFNWINRGITRRCSVYALGDEFDIDYGGLIKVAYKSSKVSKGWSIAGTDTERHLKMHSKACTLYNYKTSEVYTGTSVEVSNYTGIPTARLARILKTSTFQGWCSLSSYTKNREAYLKSRRLYTFINSKEEQVEKTASDMAKLVNDSNIHVIIRQGNTNRHVKGWKLKEITWQ